MILILITSKYDWIKIYLIRTQYKIAISVSTINDPDLRVRRKKRLPNKEINQYLFYKKRVIIIIKLI